MASELETLVTSTPEEVGLASARLGRIRDWMGRYVDEGRVPGMLVLLARGGQVCFLEAYGRSVVENDRPMTPDTLFRFYSMTKPITSVAALMLYEQGLFQLDDPVGRFVPALADMHVYVRGPSDALHTEPTRTPITIRQLLTHTSGLIYGLFNEGPLSELYKGRRTNFMRDEGPLGEIVERLATIPLAFHPGTRWRYGVSTDVLGYLIEVLSGERFDHFLHRHILGPLGMTDTCFDVPIEKVDRLAALYGPGRSGRLELLDPSQQSTFTQTAVTHSGGSGLVSTVGDYFRFTEMLRRGGEFGGKRLLGRKTVELMTSNHLAGDMAAMGESVFNESTVEGIGFGLGVSVLLDPARAQILGSPGEFAWGGLASTSFWVDPVEDLTVIALTQLLPSSTYPLRRELRVLSYQALT